MSVMNERIESAFGDEYSRIKHEGLDRFIEMRLDELLYSVYRRGYIRGHSDRSREVQNEEEQARREGRYPSEIAIRHEGDRLFIEGKDMTPRKADDQTPRRRNDDFEPR